MRSDLTLSGGLTGSRAAPTKAQAVMDADKEPLQFFCYLQALQDGESPTEHDRIASDFDFAFDYGAKSGRSFSWTLRCCHHFFSKTQYLALRPLYALD
jgi:hypothetical protein